jgi:hypothetical protein
MRVLRSKRTSGAIAITASLAAILAYGALGATPSQGPKSDGFYSSSGPGVGTEVLIPASDPFTIVRSLDLPAGNYLTSAKGVFSDLGAERSIAYCFLTDTSATGGDEDQSLASTDPTSGGVGSGTVVTLFGSGSFTSPVTVNVRCRNNGSGELRGHNFVITATRVGSLTVQP